MAARRGRVQVSITADNSGLKRGVAESEGQLGKLNAAVGKHSKSLLNAAKAATGLAAGYAAITDAKAAVDTTTELAHATLVLHRNLGLSVKSASEFAGVAKVRGIETKALTQSFGTLSKQFVALEGGSKKTVAAFKSLGITQKDVAGKPFEQQLNVVADAFGKMHGGAQRASLGMQLFGRGWQTVLPLMSQGKKGLQDQLALADKYGVTLGGKTVKSLEELIRAQRESKFATLGLQVAFGTVLAPAMTKGITAVNKFVLGIRTGTGEGGKFAAAMKPIVTVLASVAKLLKDHPKLIAGAVAAWGLYKAAGVAATAVTRAKIIASFLGLGRRAAIGGAEAGTAFGGAASTTAAGEMRGFKWRSLGNTIGAGLAIGIGLALTDKLQPQINAVAQQIADIITGVNGAKVKAANAKKFAANAAPDPLIGGTDPKTGKYVPPKTKTLVIPGGPSKPPKSKAKGRGAPARGASTSIAASVPITSGSTSGVTARAASAGGVLSFEQLQSLWIKAGGAPSMAQLMAHVALAESGGNPHAYNASGATGLWQIIGAMVPGDLYDPLVNARNAVAKYKSQGLGAWAASRGTWGKYAGLQGQPPTVSTSASAAGSVVAAAVKAKPSAADIAKGLAAPAVRRLVAGQATLNKAIRGSTAYAADIDTQIGLVTKRNDLTTEDTTTPGGRIAHIFEQQPIAGLQTQKVYALANQRNSLLAKVKGYRTAIAGLTKQMRGAKKAVRQQLAGRIQHYQGLIAKAKADARALGFTIADAMLDLQGTLSDISDAYSGTGAYAASPADAATPATGLDLIPGANAGMAAIDKEGALAALTADPRDDIKAAQDLVTGTSSILTYEQQNPGFTDSDIADAARNLKSAQDALDSLTSAVTDNTNAMTDLQAKLDLQTKIAQDAQRNLNTSQSQYAVIAKAIFDIANTGIGGRLGLGFQSVSYAGGVAKP